jgi:hypothetical protein
VLHLLPEQFDFLNERLSGVNGLWLNIGLKAFLLLFE